MNKIERIQEEHFCALFDYMSGKMRCSVSESPPLTVCASFSTLAKRGSNSNDYFILTIQIPLIHRINSIISSNISNLKCSLSYPVGSM